MLQIEELKPEDESLWQDYVLTSKKAGLYHALGWRDAVRQALGHRPYYLTAKEDGKIKGILPLFLVRSLIFGKYLSSVPAANYCGVCADNDNIRYLLINRAKKLTQELNLGYLELKESQDNDSDLIKETSHVTFIISLDSGPDMVWSRLRDNVRRTIKKAVNLSLIAHWNRAKIEDFYKIYAHTMKRLGSPLYGQNFFEKILDAFTNNAYIVSVEYQGRIIACDLVISFKDTVYSLFSGTYKEYFNLAPNNFICWQEIKQAAELGFKYFDFGRSQWHSGAFNFKKGWGGTPRQLYYSYFLNKTRKLPVKNPQDKTIKFYTGLWKRIPVFIANSLGPRIIKDFN